MATYECAKSVRLRLRVDAERLEDALEKCDTELFGAWDFDEQLEPIEYFEVDWPVLYPIDGETEADARERLEARQEAGADPIPD